MKLEKLVFASCVLFFLLAGLEVCAQDSKLPKQIRILNNYGAIPFEDGRTIVAEVVFTGLDLDYIRAETEETKEDLLTEKEVVKRLRENRANIAANDGFYGYKVAKTVRVIRDWLASNGYDQAEVAAFGEKLSKDEIKLVFSINRGVLARVSEIRFEGNVSLTNDELVADFKQCRGIDWTVFDSRKFDYMTRKCSLFYLFGKGYFQAKINGVNRRRGADGDLVTIKVQEGIRYRIGEIKIEGAKVFTEKEILEMFGQKEGDVANGKEITDFVYEKLKRTYADKGYILYDAEFDTDYIEPPGEGLDGTVNLNIGISEYKAFKISRLRFLGVEAETEKRLKEKFTLVEGEIYNRSKFEDGLKKINDAKEYFWIDGEQDVELRMDEQAGDVDIIIKLQKKD